MDLAIRDEAFVANMAHLYNMMDPSHSTAKLNVGQSLFQAMKDRREMLAGKVLVPPRASGKHSAEQLRAWGIVGVYVDPARPGGSLE